jgi:hypothetical protein
MEKLQDMIDTVFGDIDQKPAAQSLSEVAIERERAFAESASKIEALRAARMAKAESKISDSRRRGQIREAGE